MTWLIYACGSGLSVAFAAFFAKAGSKKGDSSLAAGIAVIVTCIWAFVLAKNSIIGAHLTGIGIHTWIFILLSGIVTGGAVLCFFQAMKTGEVIHVVPVEKCHIAITILAGIFVWHEKVSVNKIVAIVLMAVGALIMIISACARNTKWLLYAVVTAVCLSLSTFLEDYGVTGVGEGLMRFLRLMIALILIWTVALASGGSKHLRALSFLDGIYLCFAGAAMGLSWFLYVKACEYASESMVLAVYRLNLLMLVILATIFLKEKISGKILFGAILMIAGLEILLLKTPLIRMM